MMEAPTLSRFLLRSRMLWLTVFTLVFLSWAWWDSERYHNFISYWPKGTRAYLLESCNGGFNVRFINEYHPVAMYLGFNAGRIQLLEEYDSILADPDFHYGTIIFLAMVLCFLWHAWRWRVIRKHFQHNILTKS